jgi:hypothetical protein
MNKLLTITMLTLTVLSSASSAVMAKNTANLDRYHQTTSDQGLGAGSSDPETNLKLYDQTPPSAKTPA